MNYSFKKSPEEIAAAKRIPIEGTKFFRQEKIQAYWTVEEETARRILPPHIEPLMPLGKPMVVAYIAYFGRPEFLYPYSEAALFMLAKCGDVAGVYNFAMPVDGNDQAMDAGREYFGYPKKQAIVKLERRGEKMHGYIERNDVRYFDLDVTLGAEPNNGVIGPRVLGPEGPQEEESQVLLLKYAMDSEIDPSRSLFFRDFRVQAQANYTAVTEKINGRVDSMIFQPSEDDPWIELAPPTPEDILGCAYSKYDTIMKDSKTVYRYTDEEYEDVLPYAFAAWDTVLLGKEHTSIRTFK